MTNSKHTQKALWMSVLSIIICFAMLIGTTFAWFTDSVTSGNNKIVAGNLDVALEYSTDMANWTSVDANTNIFKDEALWEPGYTEVVYLRISNVGSLALKYQLGVNIVSETTGTNAAGKLFKLSNYIKFDVIDTDTAYADRAAARAAVTDARVISAGFSKGATLQNKNDTDCVAMVVYMPETVGNEANYKTGTAAPTIKLGIDLVATQYTYENDSFGDDYDADALPCDVLATPETIDEILATVEPGTVIGLADGTYGNITLTQNNLTLVSNSAKVDYINANAKDNCKLIGITFDAAGAQMAYGMTSTSGVNTALDYFTNVTGAENSANGADNLQIINCTFTGTPADADNYVPVSFYERNRKSGGMKSATIDGCTFETSAVYYIYAYYPGCQTQGEFKVTNNTFGGAGTSVGTAVYFGATQGNVSVIGNTFVNGSVIITPHNNASCTYALKISVVENNFINTGDDDILAIGLRNFYALSECNTLVKDNVANFGRSAIKAPYVDEDQYECYDAAPAADGIAVVKDDDGLDEAIDNGTKTLVLSSGSYIVPDSAKNKTLTIIGNGDTVVATQDDGSYEGCDYSLEGATVTFENITINTDSTTYTGYARCKGTYKNCTINGTYTLYGDSVFENCTFNVSGDVYNIWTWGAPNATFNNCTFNSDGKALLLYGQANTKLTVNNCVFNDKGGLTDKKAAIEIGNDYNKSYELIVNNTTVNGYEINDKGISTGTTLWGNKNSMGTDKLNVVVDGVDIY